MFVCKMQYMRSEENILFDILRLAEPPVSRTPCKWSILSTIAESFHSIYIRWCLKHYNLRGKIKTKRTSIENVKQSKKMEKLYRNISQPGPNPNLPAQPEPSLNCQPGPRLLLYSFSVCVCVSLGQRTFSKSTTYRPLIIKPLQQTITHSLWTI